MSSIQVITVTEQIVRKPMTLFMFYFKPRSIVTVCSEHMKACEMALPFLLLGFDSYVKYATHV